MSRTIVCVFVQNSPFEKEFSVFHFVLRLRKGKGGGTTLAYVRVQQAE